MSQRECWVNVYRMFNGEVISGGEVSNRHSAMQIERAVPMKTVLRLHIRLKPEGAPRRYASEHDRRNWETYPEEMRKCPF